MSVAYKRGSTTGPTDLNITMRNTVGSLIDPYRLQYAIFDKTTGLEVLQGSPVNTPVRMSIGQYYAQVVIPGDCNIGDWLIRWTIQETAVDPVYQSVQEFNVVGSSTIVSFTGDAYLDRMIHQLRVLLRDNNPDRNYRFRPPESENFIQGQTQVFGFIWEDEELLEYIYMAINDFNTYPPVTDISVTDITSSMKRWSTSILYKAAANACFAVALNWVNDEFGYSISGVSLDLEKSSKYMSIRDQFSAEYDKLVQAAKASIKIVKGLRQHKYGVGVQSALGPLSRPGVQSRANFVGGGMSGSWA